MPNSRLCEQIHGMMRNGLRSAIGIMQADRQRMYSTGISYGLKEEWRILLTGTEEYHHQKKRAAKHSGNNLQHQYLSK